MAKRSGDTALGGAERGECFSFGRNILSRFPKAPSPLRSAGAVQGFSPASDSASPFLNPGTEFDVGKSGKFIVATRGGLARRGFGFRHVFQVRKRGKTDLSAHGETCGVGKCIKNASARVAKGASDAFPPSARVAACPQTQKPARRLLREVLRYIFPLCGSRSERLETFSLFSTPKICAKIQKNGVASLATGLKVPNNRVARVARWSQCGVISLY